MSMLKCLYFFMGLVLVLFADFRHLVSDVIMNYGSTVE